MIVAASNFPLIVPQPVAVASENPALGSSPTLSPLDNFSLLVDSLLAQSQFPTPVDSTEPPGETARHTKTSKASRREETIDLSEPKDETKALPVEQTPLMVLAPMVAVPLEISYSLAEPTREQSQAPPSEGFNEQHPSNPAALQPTGSTTIPQQPVAIDPIPLELPVHAAPPLISAAQETWPLSVVAVPTPNWGLAPQRQPTEMTKTDAIVSPSHDVDGVEPMGDHNSILLPAATSATTSPLGQEEVGFSLDIRAAGTKPSQPPIAAVHFKSSESRSEALLPVDTLVVQREPSPVKVLIGTGSAKSAPENGGQRVDEQSEPVLDPMPVPVHPDRKPRLESIVASRREAVDEPTHEPPGPRAAMRPSSQVSEKMPKATWNPAVESLEKTPEMTERAIRLIKAPAPPVAPLLIQDGRQINVPNSPAPREVDQAPQATLLSTPPVEDLFTTHSRPVSHLSLRVPTSNAAVDLLISSRSGSLEVTALSKDQLVTEKLRAHLPELLESLHSNGYEATFGETTQTMARHASASIHEPSEEGPRGGNGGNNPASDQKNGQHRRRRQTVRFQLDGQQSAEEATI